jgi:hypothetical protein
MDAQVKYSSLLLASNYGIALKKPSYDITVGDVCFWDQEGKATRILNVFDNHQVQLTACALFLFRLRLIRVVAATTTVA